jgi:hypothetical protein
MTTTKGREAMSKPKLRNQDAHMLDAMRAEQVRQHRGATERGQHVGRTAPVEFSIYGLARIAPRGVGLRQDGRGQSDQALRSIARRLVATGDLTEKKGHRGMLLWQLAKRP